MHTEDEARKLWCPMARASGVAADEGINRDFIEPGAIPFTCIASECAAWRWVPPDTWVDPGEMPPPDGYKLTDTSNLGKHYVGPMKRGYCGCLRAL